MSGHHKFSELTKDFSPERKRAIKAETAKLLAKMDREIHIEPIVLEWSEWHSWTEVKRDAWQNGRRRLTKSRAFTKSGFGMSKTGWSSGRRVTSVCE